MIILGHICHQRLKPSTFKFTEFKTKQKNLRGLKQKNEHITGIKKYVSYIKSIGFTCAGSATKILEIK
jgi:hypothetical protein